MSAVWRCYGGRVREGIRFSKHIGCLLHSSYVHQLCIVCTCAMSYMRECLLTVSQPCLSMLSMFEDRYEVQVKMHVRDDKGRMSICIVDSCVVLT